MSLAVFLIHGADEVRILEEKMRRLDQLLPVEFRAENFTEIEPQNRPLELESCLGEILNELGTLSFFPEARRVLVVNNLANFGGESGERRSNKSAQKKSRKPADKTESELNHTQILLRFLDRELEATRNAVIFCYVEDYEKKREKIGGGNPLFKFIQQKGQVIHFKGTDDIFKFTDAVTERDLRSAIQYFRRILEADGNPHRVFNTLQRQVRFLIQAKLLQTAEARNEPENFAREHFPPDKNSNLLRQHSFVVDKIRKGASRFNYNELNAALEDLFELNKTILPRKEDVYVPDVELQFELLLIKLCKTN